ncbi:MAG TPA: hypothetical protein VKA68_06290 [bacterium]|nr:hypothetical protein [bacterium]
MIFENRFTMHPRQVRKLGEEEVESVIRYFQSGDAKAVEKRGKIKARSGFGEQSVMTLGKTLTGLFLDATDELDIESIKDAIEIVDEYMTSYVSGFITGREEHILEEQERLRKAYTTAKDQRRGAD